MGGCDRSYASTPPMGAERGLCTPPQCLSPCLSPRTPPESTSAKLPVMPPTPHTKTPTSVTSQRFSPAGRPINYTPSEASLGRPSPDLGASFSMQGFDSWGMGMQNNSFAMSSSSSACGTPAQSPCMPTSNQLKKMSARRNSLALGAGPDLLQARPPPSEGRKPISIGGLLAKQRKQLGQEGAASVAKPPPFSVSPVVGPTLVCRAASSEPRPAVRCVRRELFGDDDAQDDTDREAAPSMQLFSSACSDTLESAGAYMPSVCPPSASSFESSSILNIVSPVPCTTVLSPPYASRAMCDPNESAIMPCSYAESLDDSMSDLAAVAEACDPLPQFVSDYRCPVPHGKSLMPDRVAVVTAVNDIDEVRYVVKRYARTPPHELQRGVMTGVPSDTMVDCTRELRLYAANESDHIQLYKGCWVDPDSFCIKLEHTQVADWERIPLKQLDIMRLALHLGRALEEAHYHGVQHGRVAEGVVYYNDQKEGRRWQLGGWEASADLTQSGVQEDVAQLGELLSRLAEQQEVALEPSVALFLRDMKGGEQRRMEASDVVEIAETFC